MEKVERVSELRAATKAATRRGQQAGFVPTMGSLHEGHIALIRRACADNDVVIVSIFVNPLQFGPSEDFTRYPRSLEADLDACERAGADIVFAPSVDEMYPRPEAETRVVVGRIGDVGEGVFRPGHFDGVATVCTKLFGMVGPCRAYFGQKDAQQLAVIRQVTADLNIDVEVVECPTVREPDGLAMSSRNRYLSEEQRKAATVIYGALSAAAQMAASGEYRAQALLDRVAREVEGQPGVALQYVELADPVTFERLDTVEDGAVLQLAASLGTTRLIDNIVIELRGSSSVSL